MLFFITFFMIFGWKLNNWFDISAILCIAVIPFTFLKTGKISKYRTSVPFLSLSALIIYSVIIVAFTNFTDLYPITRATRALIVLLAGYSLLELYSDKYSNPVFELCKHIYFSLALHGTIMVSMFCSTEFLSFIYHLTKAENIVNKDVNLFDGFRICGLTYGLSQTSVLQLFGLLILPFIVKNTNNKLHKFFYLISAVIILISIFLSGRSGLFIGLLILPVYIIFEFTSNNLSIKESIIINSRKIFFYILFIVICIISVTYFLPAKFQNFTLSHSKEALLIFQNQSYTLNIIKKTLFLPDKLATILFGCGNYGRTKTFYLLSDIGWVRSIFAIGLAGTVLMAIPFFWAIYKALKIRKKYSYLSFIISSVFLATLILNFKELSLITRNQWTIQAMLLSILLNIQTNSE